MWNGLFRTRKVMDKPDLGEELLKAMFHQELDAMPTFTDEMQAHIQEELQRMVDEYNEKHANDKPTEE